MITMSLILSLSACSILTQTNYVVKRPPAEHTDSREIPELDGTTVRDLKLYTIDLIGELQKSNLDKLKILDWFDRLEEDLNR